MRSFRAPAVGVAAAAFLFAACAASARGGDLIQKKDGTFVPPIKNDPPQASDYAASNQTILNINLKELTYSIPLGNKQVTQTMLADQVMEVWIESSRYPAGWKEAVEALASGDPKAAERFRAIGDDTKVNPVVRQKALLNAARACAAVGAKNAEEAYRYVLQQFKDSFYSKAVWRELANWFMDRGDEAKALDAINEMLRLPPVTNSDQIEADFLKATVAFRKAVAAKDQSGIQRALEAYKAIVAATNGIAGLAGVNSLARLGMANAMLELGNFKEAKGLFLEISEAAKDPSLAASSFNGLGECWYRQNNPEGFAEARLCFLRTALMYADGAPPAEVAKALYYAGDCFYRLQDSEDWKDDARREIADCIRRFPQSAWAEKARRLQLNLK